MLTSIWAEKKTLLLLLLLLLLIPIIENVINKFSHKLQFTKFDLLVIIVIII